MIAKNAKRPWRCANGKPANGMLLYRKVYPPSNMAEKPQFLLVLAIEVGWKDMMSAADTFTHRRLAMAQAPFLRRRERQV